MVAPDHDAPPPTVFVAYTHDSPQHKAAVLTLAALLMSNGVQTELDQWSEGQPKSWYNWAHGYITGSDYTIIVASTQCKIVGDGGGEATENRGAGVEMRIIRGLLQKDYATWRPKLLAVVLPGREEDEIPDFLQPYEVDHFKVSALTAQGIEGLLRVIFDQPKIIRPPLGPRPVLTQLDPSSLVAVAASEPMWRVLSTEVDVSWRTDIEAVAGSRLGPWPAALEVHLVPVGKARIPSSQLRPVGQQLPLRAAAGDVLDVRSGVDTAWTEDVVRVSSRDPFRTDGGGMAVLRTGQRSAWMALPQGRIGSVLIRDDVVNKIQLMLSALMELGPALPEEVVPTVGIDPVGLVRRGEVQDLTSNQASIPMHNRSVVRLRADEAVSSADLLAMTDQVAIELAERLLAKFPEPSR